MSRQVTAVRKAVSKAPAQARAAVNKAVKQAKKMPPKAAGPCVKAEKQIAQDRDQR